MTARGIEYAIHLLVWVSWLGCVTSWLLLKINPIAAKPRIGLYLGP